MRRVLMISPHFPPDSSAATHRVRLLAPHLAAAGWEPTVLTVDPRDYEGRLDPALGSSVPQDLRVVRVRAWPARFTRALGIGDLGARAFAGLRSRSARMLATAPFDALFITIYPTYPALIGPMMKRRFRVPFVLDYQDPWVGDWGRAAGPRLDGRPDLKSRVSRAIATRLEPRALRAADGVTAVSAATFEDALARTPDARPVTTVEIPIGWDRGDREVLRSLPGIARRVPSGDGRVHLSYVGTLLPTGLDTLRALLAAAARVRSADPSCADRFRLHFFGTSNERSAEPSRRAMPLAQEMGVADIVTEHPARLDYFDALRVLADSDGVLLLGSREHHYTPSKIYPALVGARRILASYHTESTACGLLRRIGSAPAIHLVVYDDERPATARIDEFACALRQMVMQPPPPRSGFDCRALEPSSASALAVKLARVLDAVASRTRR